MNEEWLKEAEAMIARVVQNSGREQSYSGGPLASKYRGERIAAVNILMAHLARAAVQADPQPVIPPAPPECETEDEKTAYAFGYWQGLHAARAVPAHLVQQPTSWQPIESAPKDGRTLLLGHFNSRGKWRTARGQWFSADAIAESWEEPDGCDEGWYETTVECEDMPNCWATNPTHWMPLAAAPQAAPAVQPTQEPK